MYDNYTLDDLKFDIEDSLLIAEDLIEAINNKLMGFNLLGQLKDYLQHYNLDDEDLDFNELETNLVDNIDDIIQDLVELLESITDTLEDLDTSKVYVISEEKRSFYIEKISTIIEELNSLESSNGLSNEFNLKVDSDNIKKLLLECFNYEMKIKAEQAKKHNEQAKRSRRDSNGLTKKQREIKQLAAEIEILSKENKSIKDIALVLNISESKVKRLKKLNWM